MDHAKTAARIFGIAGIYGLIVLLPLFFIEPRLVPVPNRPEDYYGFLGAATAMQFFYLAIARDPVRLRPLMPFAVLAKLSFFIPILILWLAGRTAGVTLGFASVDALIGVAFACAWLATRESP